MIRYGTSSGKECLGILGESSESPVGYLKPAALQPAYNSLGVVGQGPTPVVLDLDAAVGQLLEFLFERLLSGRPRGALALYDSVEPQNKRLVLRGLCRLRQMDRNKNGQYRHK